MPTLTIARRELSALFFSPIAYVVMGLFGGVTTLVFIQKCFNPGDPASLAGLLWPWVLILLIFVVPAISMRLVSEEFGRGTVETLMTAPLSDTQMVLGKFLGAFIFLLATLAWLLVPVIIMLFVSRPDYGPILTSLLGMLLVGSLFLAIGMFASCVTSNQIIAFILGIFMILPLVLADLMVDVVNRVSLPHGLEWVRPTVLYIGVFSQVDGFVRGVFSLANVVYFVSGICIFLFMAVKVIESRRWR
jgi:ABC-2 type transport system permease protein